MTAALDLALLRGLPLPVLAADGDKEDRGAVLVVGGGVALAGAVLLTGLAALRVGAGKLQISGGEPYAAAMALAIPEAMILATPLTRAGELAGKAARVLTPAARRAGAIVVGPGMPTTGRARRLARRLLEAAEGSAVLDAGAMPALGEAHAFAVLSGGRVVLTPHAGEMAAMLQIEKAAVRDDPLTAARTAAALFQSVVVMKGATTHVVSPDGTAWRHDGGSKGLATSGSGDVLAGTIAGLLARGAPPATAALWGVWLHADAGRSLSRDGAPIGFLARELLPALPVSLAAACGAASPV